VDAVAVRGRARRTPLGPETPTATFSIAGRLAHHSRTRRPHLSSHAPWAGLLAEMISDENRPDNPARPPVKPPPTGATRANRRTPEAESPIDNDPLVETIMNAGPAKALG